MKIKTLYEKQGQETGNLTPELKLLYDGGLSFPESSRERPYVIVNFVQTIDGVVASYKRPGCSCGETLSGSNFADHSIMGVLRARCDAILVGSGTLHGDPGIVRTPFLICPENATLYANLRRKLRKPSLPLNVILTASGIIDLNEPTFHTKGLRAVIITTDEGAARLNAHSRNELGNAIVCSTGESGKTTPEEVLRVLTEEFGVRLLLLEGGPTVLGQFLEAKKVDELFLTIAPQIAGRNATKPRPSIARNTLFLPETAPWLKLCSVKKAGEHLFLRYTL